MKWQFMNQNFCFSWIFSLYPLNYLSWILRLRHQSIHHNITDFIQPNLGNSFLFYIFSGRVKTFSLVPMWHRRQNRFPRAMSHLLWGNALIIQTSVWLTVRLWLVWILPRYVLRILLYVSFSFPMAPDDFPPIALSPLTPEAFLPLLSHVSLLLSH